MGLVAALIAARFLLYTYFFQTPSTLVVYVAGYEDPENFVNVNFFLTQGIRCVGRGCPAAHADRRRLVACVTGALGGV